ncbi:MAG: ABC transporter ATP-binding protein/permease [Gemmatimonadota bacterium]|nr:ABC transporter ATP-binding protein/permease [Gemmatimonadota bacterium]MDH5283832.1 ABC transporter ATP-binding protein/permease [Gemmatimonadota bacterium]
MSSDARTPTRLLDITPLRQGLALVWESGRGWTALQIALLVLASMVPLLALYVTKEIIDTVAEALAGGPRDPGRLTLLVAFAGGVGIAAAGLRLLSGLVSEVQGIRLSDRVQEILHRKSVEVDLAFYENPEYHDTLHRAQTEAPFRPAQIVASCAQVGQGGLSLLALVGLLLSFHWLLVVALLAAALPGLFVKVRYSSRLYQWMRRQTALQRLSRYLSLLLTTVDSAKEIRLLGLGAEFRRRHRLLRQQANREKLQLATRRSGFELLAQVVAVAAVFGSMFVIAQRALTGAVTVGDMVMYFGAFQRAQDCFRDFLAGLAGLYEQNLFLTDFKRFLTLEPTVTDPPKPAPYPRPLRNGIEFDHVSFRYPGTEREVLTDVSFSIRPGVHMALVGENGSGKTTLVKLLCRLYDPTSGVIRIDGTDLREFSLAELRAELSVVFQDYTRYCLSARDNIRLGNIALPPDSPRIAEAARRTGADAIIRSLPLGYETLLSRQFEQGADLSMGQWQKLALARAFLRDSQLIVLDEPTAALDPKAEAEVFDQFHELAKGRTAVVISHRLSTVRHADRILVLVDGQVAEAGAHDELVERAGVYARLFETQARPYR